MVLICGYLGFHLRFIFSPNLQLPSYENPGEYKFSKQPDSLILSYHNPFLWEENKRNIILNKERIFEQGESEKDQKPPFKFVGVIGTERRKKAIIDYQGTVILARKDDLLEGFKIMDIRDSLLCLNRNNKSFFLKIFDDKQFPF